MGSEESWLLLQIYSLRTDPVDDRRWAVLEVHGWIFHSAYKYFRLLQVLPHQVLVVLPVIAVITTTLFTVFCHAFSWQINDDDDDENKRKVISPG